MAASAALLPAAPGRTMDEQAALLQAILDEPDSDVHRLVYADWLDEHGRPRRAAFIRAQCALAPFGRENADPFTAPVGIDGWHLHPADREEFLAPFLDLGGTFGVAEEAPLVERVCQAYSLLFVRGFVEAVMVFGGRAAFRLADQAEAVFAATPLLHLRISARPHRRTVHDWRERDHLTQITLRRLLRVEGLRRLRTLDLLEQPLGEPGLELLLECPHLDGLRGLWLAHELLVHNGTRTSLRQRFGDVLHLHEVPF